MQKGTFFALLQLGHVGRVSKMDSKNSSEIGEQRKSRRGFIKKSSVVAGIAILPASNVWGVCNTSGVSGGSQQVNATCTVPRLTGGLSVNQWRQLATGNVSVNERKALARVVSNIKFDDKFESADTYKAESYCTRLNAVLNRRHIKVDGNNLIPDLIRISIFNAINSSNHHESLMGAMGANLLLGYTVREGQFTGAGGAKLLLDHVWGSLKVGPMGEDRRLASQFTGGTITEAMLIFRIEQNEKLF